MDKVSHHVRQDISSNHTTFPLHRHRATVDAFLYNRSFFHIQHSDELFSEEIFTTLLEAQILIEL